MTTRRDFIKELLLGGVGFAIAPRILAAEDPWQTVFPSILNRIKPPRFPKRTL